MFFPFSLHFFTAVLIYIVRADSYYKLYTLPYICLCNLSSVCKVVYLRLTISLYISAFPVILNV